MDTILFIIYAITSIAYIPLFIAIMIKMRKSFSKLYLEIRCKLNMIFSVYIFFLCARLYLFADIKSFKEIFKEPSIYGVIPFFLSEIILTIAITYVLFSVSRMERSS